MKKTIYDSKEYLEKMQAWWRAANYLSVGQMYLRNNPLLRDEIKAEDIKIYPIGHWGTISGQNFAYVNLNRVINKYDLNMFYIEGPGHGGQVMISNSYLDGSYSERFPKASQDIEGLKYLFKNFSFPGGTASHAAPETPGSIHEGGELGYSLSHATGAILDNPDVIAAAIVGDGESETGPLATSWWSNEFINPVTDGAVLPILHLNGGKISNPTILCRRSNEDLANYFAGMGWEAHFVEGDKPEEMFEKMTQTLDTVIEKILKIQATARKKPADKAKRPVWPMIVLRTPKGWTGPKEWNHEQIVGSFRAHQVPLPTKSENLTGLKELEKWLRSYRPEELFDKKGKVIKAIFDLAPKGNKRMAMNPITNGGLNPKPLKLGNWKDFALKFTKPGSVMAQDMVELGTYYADVIKRNPTTFRLFGPDETKSNRLYNVFKATNRVWMDRIDSKLDEALSPQGRVIDSQLSEHQCEGFLEGYVLTGRHGAFASYESFLRVIDSMLTQHMKWLKKANDTSWHRHDYPSLNVIATSTAFQQDHNGYTHQDPGLLGHLADKRPELINQYLPADTNTLLAVMDKALKSRQCINHIIASKQPRDQFFTIDEAEELVAKGLKVIDWASTANANEEPDLVMASAGTEPTIEALASISYLHEAFPDLKIRFVNVVDFHKLRSDKLDPNGLSDEEFDKIFTKNKPVVFAFHGFEGVLRDFFFNRHNHNLIAHGYREDGDITTSFDIRLYSEMDRFHISIDAAKAVLGNKANSFVNEMEEKIAYHKQYTREYGTDIPEVKEWKWQELK